MGARARRIALLFPLCIVLSFFCALSVQAAEGAVGEDTYQSFWENLPSLAEGAVPERLTDTEALEEKLGMAQRFSRMQDGLVEFASGSGEQECPLQLHLCTLRRILHRLWKCAQKVLLSRLLSGIPQ